MPMLESPRAVARLIARVHREISGPRNERIAARVSSFGRSVSTVSAGCDTVRTGPSPRSTAPSRGHRPGDAVIACDPRKGGVLAAHALDDPRGKPAAGCECCKLVHSPPRRTGPFRRSRRAVRGPGGRAMAAHQVIDQGLLFRCECGRGSMAARSVSLLTM